MAGTGMSCGKRDLRQRAQHVFGVRRERARSLQRVERAGGVTLAGLQARQQEKRLHRLVALGRRPQQLLRFSATAGGDRRGGLLDQRVASSGQTLR